MNVATVPLYTGTLLTNVRYKWITAGVPGVEQSSGITQPDPRFSLFRVNGSSPTGAEELFVYDSTNVNNWNTVPVR